MSSRDWLFRIKDILAAIRKKPKRRPGALNGKIKIAEDFDAPLHEDILSLFENSL